MGIESGYKETLRPRKAEEFDKSSASRLLYDTACVFACENMYVRCLARRGHTHPSRETRGGANRAYRALLLLGTRSR